jgi:uncharacterized protein Usg
MWTSTIRKRWDNPEWWINKGIPAGMRKIIREIYHPFISYRAGSIQSICNEEWDLLIILDACRLDTFRSVSSFDTVEVRSWGTPTTPSFLKKHSNEPHLDTVYVSANPHIAPHEDSFHHIKHVWQKNWDEDLHTVRPEQVVIATKTAAEEYPDKRIIAHFMQPHQPYIGNSALEELGVLSGVENARRVAKDGTTILDLDEEFPHVFTLLRNGELDRDTAMTYYKENLEVVLPAVEELLEWWDYRAAVTADHGELFGERYFPMPKRKYGHFPDMWHPALVLVPWVAISGKRRSTTAERGQQKNYLDDQSVEDRLKSLGYT